MRSQYRPRICQESSSASCHRIFKDFGEMERQQSHEMRGVTWLCEISLTPAWLQYAGIPHPTRPLASSPAPGGRGQSWRYPRKAVSGRGNPRASSLFRPSPYPGPWEVYSRGGWADGEGAKSPLLCLSAFNMTVKGAKRGKHIPKDLSNARLTMSTSTQRPLRTQMQPSLRKA